MYYVDWEELFLIYSLVRGTKEEATWIQGEVRHAGQVVDYCEVTTVEERDLDSFCGGQADEAACVDGGDGDDVRAAAGHDAQVLAAG